MRLNLFNVCIFVEMKIRIAFVNDIPKIVDVASKTWHNTYKNIISQEQIDFMFEKCTLPMLYLNKCKMDIHF